MGIETLCLKEAAHLITKDSKYWNLLGYMYFISLKNPIRARIFRAGYFFIRHIDDILDNDRKCPENPKDYVLKIVDNMKNGNSRAAPPIMDLYSFALSKINHMASGRDKPKDDFENVIQAMLFDYERSRMRMNLSRQELERYYEDTFNPLLNLSLILADSKLRGKDVPQLASTMGHIYSVRDLKEDLQNNIINIPTEELENSGLNIDYGIDYEKVRGNASLSNWIDDEIKTYSLYVHKLHELGDKGYKIVSSPLIRGMRSICKRYFKEREIVMESHKVL